MTEHPITPREDRKRIAQKLVELSSDRLSITPKPNYIALKLGGGAYSVVAKVGLQKDRVSFHIPSAELVKQAVEAGFEPKNGGSSLQFFLHKSHFHGLTLSDIQENEPLFRAIVEGSLNYVLSQMPKTK